jgi:hypothetical protein
MNGFLFIGDLFLNTSSPGRRIDDDFLSVVLNKVKFSMDLAKDKGLLPVFTGQSFYKTLDVKVLTEIIPILKDSGAYFLPSTIEQDSKTRLLIPKSTLAILKATDIVNTIDHLNPLTIDINGNKCSLHSSNSGILFEKTSKLSSFNFLLMRNPNIEEKEQIDDLYDFSGINMIINSGTKIESDEFTINDHKWKNIGPSVRIHLDSEELAPKVFEWSPENGYKEYILPHNKHVMNHNALTKNIDDQNLVKSDFALMMREEMTRLEQENDADIIETELTEILISMDSSIKIREQIYNLQKEVEME